MFKPKRMNRISIVGPKTVMKDVIGELYDMKLLHIKDYLKGDEPESLDIGSPLPESDKISHALVKLRSIESYLPKTATKDVKTDPVEKIGEKIQNIESEVIEKIEEIKRIDDERSKLASALDDISVVSCLPISIDAYTQYETITYFAGYVKEMKFEPKIKKMTDKCNIYTGIHGKKRVAAVFVEKEYAERARTALNESGFSEINTEALAGLGGDTKKAISDINTSINKLDERKIKINKDLEKISERWASYISSSEKRLSEESDKAQAPLRFSVSDNAFIAEGWVPTDKFSQMHEKLTTKTGDKIFIKNVNDSYDAPIALDNKGPAKSFGFFLDLYSLPSYREIDPTFFMFIMFPVFFGFMLGDWGYGLLTLIIFTALKFKVPKMKDILNVMIIASLSTIVFGVLYDEFFGIELFHEMGIHAPHLLSRADSEGASMLIVYALALGTLHILSGFLLGFVNELRMHGLKAAVLEKLSWVIYMAGFFPALLAFFGMVDYIPEYRYILLAGGVVLIVLGEGIKGVLELISPLTNVLSYARLMAVGLASVILAEVVNEMTHPLFGAGPLGFILGTIVLVAGHAINIGLGLMSPFIHSMRLHYVEFFLKFYHGGGKKYIPFGLKGSS